MTDKTIETLLNELEGDPGRTMLEIGRCEEVKQQILTHCRELTEERNRLKAVLANVKGVANYYNSDIHANHKYEGRVFSQDLERMLNPTKEAHRE